MATATTALEKTLANIGARKAAADADYAKLVIDLADDRGVDTEDVIAICGDAGKSLADLSSDVERLTRRREAAAILATLPDALDAVQSTNKAKLMTEHIAARDLQATLADIERQRLTAVALHDKKNADAEAALEAAKALLAGVKAAKQFLFDSAPNAARLAELRERRAELQAAAAAVRSRRPAVGGAEWQQRGEAEQITAIHARGDKIDAEILAAEAEAVRV